MTSKELLGKQEEKQAIALGVLKEYEQLDYEGLKECLGLEDDEMQEVMRGIKYNGLAREVSHKTGAKFYVPEW